MEWLLAILIIFPNEKKMVAYKAVDTQSACQELAQEAVNAAAVDGLTLKYKCTELHGRDPTVLAFAIADYMGGGE